MTVVTKGIAFQKVSPYQVLSDTPNQSTENNFGTNLLYFLIILGVIGGIGYGIYYLLNLPENTTPAATTKDGGDGGGDGDGDGDGDGKTDDDNEKQSSSPSIKKGFSWWKILLIALACAFVLSNIIYYFKLKSLKKRRNINLEDYTKYTPEEWERLRKKLFKVFKLFQSIEKYANNEILDKRTLDKDINQLEDILDFTKKYTTKLKEDYKNKPGLKVVTMEEDLNAFTTRLNELKELSDNYQKKK